MGNALEGSFYTQVLKIEKFEEPRFEFGQIFDSKSSHEIARRFVDADTIEIFESFSVIFLNRANRPISFAELSRGGTSGTVADIKLIFCHALLCGACAIIAIHNHPSGSLSPSQADIELTKRLITAGKHLEITVLDHLILSAKEYYSFADNGLMHE